MNAEIISLEDFLAQATTLLGETGRNLQNLAQLALLQSTQFDHDHENGRSDGQDETSARLQQISQQLAKLSRQSQTLQAYLQSNADDPLTDEEHWPRVKILQSQEEERTQLARKLENGVGQLLANAVFELASCRRLLANDLQAVAEGLDALQAELEHGLADIRQFIIDLEPATILSNFGLGAGIRRYLEQFEARTGLKTQLRINTTIGRLPSIIEVAIFRVIQEALSNAYQHANATQVEVVFEEKDNTLQFSITDNGDGLAPERVGTARKNLGLARMVDYAQLLNGNLRILSDLGRGTQVVLTIAYPAL